jgi:hypothetical protein
MTDKRSGRIVLVAVLLLAHAAPAGAVDYPDPKLTPGATVPMTVRRLCSTKWGKDARHVSAAMKREVFELYGLSGNDAASCGTDAHGRHCEVDHAISRELGGADVVANLWPQSYSSEWSAGRKDKLENRLHREVCAGRLELGDAQAMIRGDWRGAYLRYWPEGSGR